MYFNVAVLHKLYFSTTVLHKLYFSATVLHKLYFSVTILQKLYFSVTILHKLYFSVTVLLTLCFNITPLHNLYFTFKPNPENATANFLHYVLQYTYSWLDFGAFGEPRKEVINFKSVHTSLHMYRRGSHYALFREI